MQHSYFTSQRAHALEPSATATGVACECPAGRGRGTAVTCKCARSSCSPSAHTVMPAASPCRHLDVQANIFEGHELSKMHGLLG